MVHTDSYVAQATRALRESNNDLDGAFQVYRRGATILINRIATPFEESLLPQCIARGFQHSWQPAETWNGCVEFTLLVSIATTLGFFTLSLLQSQYYYSPTTWIFFSLTPSEGDMPG